MKHLSHHEQRFARLFDFLREHYVQAPDGHRLAEEARLSPRHLHRLYRQVMGESLHCTVKWMRLHRAAWLLSYSDKPVAAIAGECGYQGNAQSFARAFRAMYGMTPHQFRQLPRENDYAVEVMEMAAIPLLGLAHRGDYQRLGESFAKLEAILRLRGLMPDAPRVFAVLHDDPEKVAAEGLQSCIAVAGEGDCRAPLLHAAVAGGLYARVCHDGAAADIDRAFCWLFESWLAQSGWRVDRERCMMIEFAAPLREVLPGAQRCYVYIPLYK